MRSAGVPNQLYSQCRTNQIEPHVTDRAHIMDRTDSTSDGVCHIAERVATAIFEQGLARVPWSDNRRADPRPRLPSGISGVMADALSRGEALDARLGPDAAAGDPASSGEGEHQNPHRIGGGGATSCLRRVRSRSTACGSMLATPPSRMSSSLGSRPSEGSELVVGDAP
jgi:hypothetical protein